MVHRFATFEIDEAARELRAGARVLDVQPRVFDLLVFLAKNRERVVPKEELLETVWPGVVVTDASLQRAISLARAALVAAGAGDVIRTHARQGYRFRIEEPAEAAANETAASAALARAAYARGDWEGAIAALKQVDALEGLTADDLQRWAHAAQCAGRPAEALVPLERAVAAYSARGDRRHAGWAAILIGHLRLEWREPVLANGWYQRASRLLEGEPPCREKGYLDFLGGRMAFMNGDVEHALELTRRARETGEVFNDPDLEGIALAYHGEASLFLGNVREGVAALDEAGVSVVANGMSPWAGGQVYCCVIYASMNRADWHRAGQWTEQFTRWCADKGTDGYPGLCRLHRAEVLTVRGQLDEAESEVRSAIGMLARNAPWAEGDAWTALGDIQLARGEFPAAREAFAKATELGWEAQYGLALLRLAEGDANSAARLLGRINADTGRLGASRRGQSLAWFAVAAALAGQPDDAREALTRVEADPDLAAPPAVQALIERARGEIAAAEGCVAEAITHFRAALRRWQQLDAPLAGAQTRCRLAAVLAADGDQESAALELNAAVTAFTQAGASRLLTSCAKLRAALAGTTAHSPAKARPARAR